ncbi:MAG: acyltransferase family protein [Clostridia bacterium]|nr:acyltransferase family protein [Clostridia bacterium]
MAKERIHWVDVAKGIAILCVFFGHAVGVPEALKQFIYTFHMPLFFFLSGYCFSTRRKAGDFIVNKLKTTVLPIFTLGLTGSVIISLLLKIVEGQPVDWKWVFLSPVVQYGSHNLLWFLAALFVASIMFYGLAKLFKDKKLLLFAVTLLLGLGAYYYIHIVKFMLPWYVDTAIVALPFMAAGYYLKDVKEPGKKVSIPVAAVSFLICSVSGMTNFNIFGGADMHGNAYGNIYLFYLGAFAGCVMVYCVSIIINKNRALEYFGRNSLIFYAMEPIQYFVNFILKITGAGYNEFGFFAHLLFTVIAVALVTALNSVMAYFINKFFPFLIGKSKETAETRKT